MKLKNILDTPRHNHNTLEMSGHLKNTDIRYKEPNKLGIVISQYSLYSFLLGILLALFVESFARVILVVFQITTDGITALIIAASIVIQLSNVIFFYLKFFKKARREMDALLEEINEPEIDNKPS